MFSLPILSSISHLFRVRAEENSMFLIWSPPPSLLLIPTNRMFQDHGNQDPHDEPILQEGTHNSWNTVKRSRRYRHKSQPEQNRGSNTINTLVRERHSLNVVKGRSE